MRRATARRYGRDRSSAGDSLIAPGPKVHRAATGEYRDLDRDEELSECFDESWRMSEIPHPTHYR